MEQSTSTLYFNNDSINSLLTREEEIRAWRKATDIAKIEYIESNINWDNFDKIKVKSISTYINHIMS